MAKLQLTLTEADIKEAVLQAAHKLGYSGNFKTVTLNISDNIDDRGGGKFGHNVTATVSE